MLPPIIVDQSIVDRPPPPIPSEHYLPSPSNINGNTNGNERTSRRYSYTPATPATPVTSQPPPVPAPMTMPTPEPWRDPDNPRRHGNPDDAAMMAHVRALEEARKLADGEVDEEDEESMQRYVMSKFGDQSGQNHDDTESESKTSTEETESTSESSSTASERDHYVPSQSDRDLYYPNRDRDNQSRGTSVPAITVNSPSNDSNGSSAVTRTTNRDLLNPAYRPAPQLLQYNDDDYDESLENEPIDFDEIPGTLPPPPPSIPSPAPEHIDGIPAPYIGAPRTPEYTPNQYSRPPPLGPEVPESSSRWYPSRSPGIGLQPPGLPDFTNFDGELDSLKYEPSNRNPSRNSGRGSSNSFTRPNAQPSYQPPFRAPPQPAPPVISVTTPSTSRSNSQGNSPALAPPAAPDRSPSAHALPMPSMTPRGFGASLGAGISAGLGFARNSFLRGGTSAPPAPAPAPAPVLSPVSPPVVAPVQARTPAPVIPGPASAPTPAPRTSSRAGGPSNGRPSGGYRSTLGVPHSVPMAPPVGSPRRPDVVASKPPPQQPKQFPLTRPNSRFTDRNQNKTRAMVERFQALRDEQDLERQRQWDTSHGGVGGFGLDNTSMEQSRPPSPAGSVRSKKSRAVTVVSTSDEDDWTTGRSMRGRPT
ncbi:hypothetical protein FRC08_002479 [Ceratobasidium sp. 394]|nr:hypothetical protein FRC08_002479 [Ceratobasidium sp. 394]